LRRTKVGRARLGKPGMLRRNKMQTTRRNRVIVGSTQ
jgi:hypothetical protein